MKLFFALFSEIKLRDLWTRARRGVLYAFVLIGSILLQDVILSNIPILGVKCVFLPTLVVAVALFEGGWRGGLFGVAAGVLFDLFCGSHGVLFTVIYPVIAFAIGFFADFFLNRRFFSYAVLGVLTLSFCSFVQMFSMLFYQGQALGALLRTAIIQTILGLPFLYPSYAICKLFPRRVGVDIPSPY